MSTNLKPVTSGNAVNLWTVKAVEEYFREAVLTLKKLPPVKQRGYFNLWPDIIYSPNELLFQEKKPMRLTTSPEAIARLEQIFEWMRWVTVEERKLLWKRAENKHWKVICWELKCDRTTAWRKWVLACTKIVTSLNASKCNAFDVATK